MSRPRPETQLALVDLVVVGDEIESVITAVAAAKQGLEVVVVRSAGAGQWLGGLSTRGGLAYMDITPECIGGLFGDFLVAAEVQRVALVPQRAHDVLAAWLSEHRIRMIEGVTVKPKTQTTTPVAQLALSNGQTLQARMVVDATPDADLARLYRVAYREGLGGLLRQVDRQAPDFLGVTPVFTLSGVSVTQMQDFEAALRDERGLKAMLDEALPYHAASLRADYKTRPTYSPPGSDYLDILNPTIGVYFHRWRGEKARTYPDAQTWIDGGNVALLPGRMAFNGLVMRVDDLPELLSYSHGAPIPAPLMYAMEQFEAFLQREGGMTSARIDPPQALYVRQTVNLKTRRVITAQNLLSGGVSPEKSVGVFSYWIDMRGVTLSRYFGEISLPKPMFGVSLDGALFDEPRLANLAVVSRSGGYSSLAQGAGRIVQHLSMLGEAVGVAAAVAIRRSQSLSEVSIRKVQQALASASTEKSKAFNTQDLAPLLTLDAAC